ncbi:MAG: FKBP-type peptidyl-prolyl cis-trans isomerase [Polyangiaceae bacterium]
MVLVAPPPPPPRPVVAPAVDSAPAADEPPAPRHVDGFRPDGLEVHVLAPGSGRAAQDGDHLRVDYVGTLLDGKQFDSSHDKGRVPFRFVLGQGSVIKGWDEGVVGMQVGEIRRLTLPPELAYGERGRSPMIPPHATLVYEVQLLAIDSP